MQKLQEKHPHFCGKNWVIHKSQVMEIHKDETNTPVQEEKNQYRTDVQPTTTTEVQVQPNPAASPPPSSTSSPSREFSFSIALPPPPAANKNNNNKTESTTPSPSLPPLLATTIDLSPADEIFFHGHLLPLHLLSQHHPISSARSSTNSLDSFITFTLNDELLHGLENKSKDVVFADTDDVEDIIDDYDHENISHVDSEGKVRAGKSRSFSHLFLKWRKHHHHHDDGPDQNHDDAHHHKHRTWKPKFDMVKRYMRLVKPYIHIPFVRHKRAAGHELLLRHPTAFNSYSGRLRVMRKSNKDSLVIRAGRRSEFSSAPVSIKTSPTNSGLLVASEIATPTMTFNNESAVDELQAAIQAAIAHCKNSINAE